MEESCQLHSKFLTTDFLEVKYAASNSCVEQLQVRRISYQTIVFIHTLPLIILIKLICGFLKILTDLLIAICCVSGFVLSWLPFYIFAISNIHGFSHISMVLLTMLYFCNGVANPIVFFVFHRSRHNLSSTTTTRTSHLTMSLMQNQCGNVSEHNSLNGAQFVHFKSLIKW